MVVFMDTSSLLKHYIEEEGGAQVDLYFVDENDIWISAITPLEFNSALRRKLKESTIDQESYEKAIDCWKQDQSSFVIVSFSARLIEKALEMVHSHGTKTLDSIQIGSALISDKEVWVTSDKGMHGVMKSLEKKSTVLI